MMLSVTQRSATKSRSLKCARVLVTNKSPTSIVDEKKYFSDTLLVTTS